jgi:hypothetical protein
MKRRYMLYAVAIAGLGAAVLSDQRSLADEEVVQPVARTAQQRPPALVAPANRESVRAPDAAPSDSVLALVARNAPDRYADAGAQATAFSAHSWKPAASAIAAASEPAAPSQPPFTYIGRQPVAGGWQVFVVENDVVQAVKPDDLIDDQYKVLSIGETEMTLEYLPLHIKFSMALE